MSGDGAWTPPGGEPAPEWASVEGWAERAGRAEPPAEPPPWQAAGLGVVPLRPLAVGELLDGAVRTMRRHVRATLGIAAVVVVVQQLVRLAFAAAAGDLAGGNGSLFISGSSFGTGAGLAAYVVDAVLSAVLTGLITAVVLDDAAGRPVSVAAAWERVRPLTWRLVGASVLAGLLPFLGLVGLILLGVFLWAALALAPAVVVAEDTRVWQSLRRSWRLVVPSWWRVFGVLLLGVLIAAVVGSIVDVPVFVVVGVTGVSGNTLGPGAYTAAVVFSTLGAIVTRPFVAALTALVYLDRRMRGEGLDLELPSAAAAPTPRTQA